MIGDLGTYDLLALGTLKAKAAWKMYARANGIDPQVANKVSYQIGDYEQAKKHADNPDDVNIEDFIAPEFKDLFEGCRRYLGIYDNRKAHPCGCLAYSGDAEADIGVILCKSEATGNEVLTAVIESGTIDAFGYLKQDYLIVDSIGLTYDIYKEIGIEPYTVNQLLDKIKTDDATWNIYRDGFTQCVNQCEQPKSTQKVMRYKPKNISELTQFIAGIRPGFQSMYHLFESRQHFEYGIKALDDLIQDEYRTSSFIIYQEDLMKVLEFAGFPMAETYTIIKAISKKKDYVIKEAKPKFISGFAKSIMDTGETDDESKANELADKVWHIVEDNSAYGFNCVSGDTIISGHTKTIAELYNILHTQGKKLYSYSMTEDYRFRANRIIDIYKQQEAPVYLVETYTGENIKCTGNHKFPTSNGIKTALELTDEDFLFIKVGKDIPIKSRFKSIEPAGIETVYDIEMSGDVAHNFVLSNGLVTCNSAHAYCMAIDSVTIAYLKAHYPLEFYKCVLQRYTNKGDKSKVSLIKQEMLRRGYQLKDAKFGDDNRQFNIDRENNYITQTLTSIKGMPKTTPQALYELGQSGIKTRSQLYQSLIDNPNINVKAIDILFKLDYFSMFAPPNKLIDEFTIYQKYCNSKALSKSKLTNEEIEAVRPYCGTETEKQFRNLDNNKLIQALIKTYPIRKTSIVDRIKYQLELLEYSTLKDENESVDNWIVVNIDQNNYGTTKVTMYNICHGVMRTYRANRHFIKTHPLKAGNYIECLFQEKDRMRKMDDGTFKTTGEKIIELKAWKYLDK